MSMLDWAKKEIEIACKRENPDHKEGEWDYGIACYESALKAFESLCEDGHSGMSIGLTKAILNRLIDGKPLTPIEDTPDVWRLCGSNHDDDYDTYQCKRMSSLFKDVYKDGRVKYSDVNRYYCVTIESPNVPFTNGLVGKIIDEMFPIEMPYSPEDTIKVVCREFLVDPRNGDYDTIGVLYAIKENGEKIPINRYFKDGEREMVEISKREYLTRKSKIK